MTLAVVDTPKWSQVRLGELFQIKHGFAFKGEYFCNEGDQIVLTPGNFEQDGGLKFKGDKEKYYSGDYPEEYHLSAGDLLVVMTDLTQEAKLLGSAAFVPPGLYLLHKSASRKNY